MPAADQAHLWLPYCQMETAPLPLCAVRTAGATITLDDGRTLVDGIASWWTACHGYNHPHLLEAAARQLHTMPHVMFGGLIHPPAEALAETLVAVSPPGMARVFFSDSGSVAVEVALKMALQYWRNRGQPRRTRILTFRHAYHGDTFGAMSVSDPEQNYHHAFKAMLPRQFVLDLPADEYAFAELDALLADIAPQTAAMIVEPLVQCAGGMRFHGPDVLAELRRLAARHNILFIADEIATGFGRTGHLFACEEAGIMPDILCLGKALTGGIMTLAATLTTAAVFDGFRSTDATHALMHGPTYMANPLACSAALASLELFRLEPRLAQVAAIEQQLHAQLAPLSPHPAVRDVRVRGAIGVVELAGIHNPATLRAHFVEAGVWVRPLTTATGTVIYLSPAFTITTDELTQLTQAVCTVVSGLHLPIGPAEP